MKKTDNNKKQMRLWAVIIVVGLIIAGYFLWKSASGDSQGTTSAPAPGELETLETTETSFVVESATYSDKEHVAAYIQAFSHLPANYISKNKADNTPNWQKDGYYIGGDRFGNYEGLLPKKSGRTYYECDVDYSNTNIKKGNRGTKRLVWSNDGLIFYTGDHYESFTQLYP